MKVNVGTTDRIIRVILGIALLALGIFVLTDIWRILAIAAGAVALITALTGYCGLYSLVGIRTCKLKPPR